MASEEEIKPIEEIENGAVKNAGNNEPPVDVQSPQSPKIEPPKAPPVPPPPPPDKTGRKAIIKRGGSPLPKLILTILVILVALAAVFYFFFYRVSVDINPDPRPDRILIDSQEVKPGTFKFMPGMHSITIEKKGYISYIVNRKFGINEHVKLNFNFEQQKAAQASVAGGRFPILSSDQKFLFFLDSTSAISVMNLGDQSTPPTKLSNGQYPTAKIVKISKNNNFALILDNEAIKILDFSKTDLINQVEAKLPPLASAIHSVSWNDNESQYFTEANSKIIYDLLTSSGWDVYLANRAHSEANMIMQFDQGFKNPMFDWGESPNQVLIAGGELGILDLSKRDYQTISKDHDFVFAKWGPNAKNAIAIDAEGAVYKINQDNKIEQLPFSSGKGLVSFIDENTLAGISQGRPVQYNFDTKSLINYAEVKDLDKSRSFVARSDIFYFETDKGILSGKFEQPGYK